MNRLRECREKAGLTQKQVAITLKLAGPSVSNWESGKTKPSRENIQKLADLYNVSVDYLLCREDDTAQTADEPADDDRELWELREKVRRDPERHYLFKLASNGTIDDVRRAVAIIDALKQTK